MKAETGNEAAQFHFWKYLFQIFDTVCTISSRIKNNYIKNIIKSIAGTALALEYEGKCHPFAIILALSPQIMNGVDTPPPPPVSIF